MEEMYQKSLEMIKKLPEIPSGEEWNEIAQKNGLMNYLTLQYIENERFHALCEKIRRAS